MHVLYTCMLLCFKKYFKAIMERIVFGRARVVLILVLAPFARAFAPLLLAPSSTAVYVKSWKEGLILHSHQSGQETLQGLPPPIGNRYGLAALSTRAQRLRELLTDKEIINDLTEAEFALTLAKTFEESKGQEEAVALAGRPKAARLPVERRGASSIDFDSLVAKLTRHEGNLEERRTTTLGSRSASPAGSDRRADSEDLSSFEVFAGLNSAQLDSLMQRVSETATLLRAARQRRRDAQLQAEEARRAVALAAAKTKAEEEEAELKSNAEEGGGSSSGVGGGVGRGVVGSWKRNKNLEALFPSSQRLKAQKRLDRLKAWTRKSSAKLSDAPEDAAETAAATPSSSSSSSSSPSSSSPAPPPSTNSSSGKAPVVSVDELVESMVANPFNASSMLEEQFAVFVREDGTVDLDKAVETGKEVARFSAELWARLNGAATAQEDGGGSGGSGKNGSGSTASAGASSGMTFDQVLAEVEAAPGVVAAAARLSASKRLLRDVATQRTATTASASADATPPPAAAAAAAAAVSADVSADVSANRAGGGNDGQQPRDAGEDASSTSAAATAEAAAAATDGAGAVPAAAIPVQKLKRALRVMERAAVRRCRLAALDYDMERACGVVALEIEGRVAGSGSVNDAWTESWRSEQRRLVAEFGLLDAQLCVLLQVLRATDDNAAAAAADAAVDAAADDGGFAEADVDGDGLISKDEWVAFVSSGRFAGAADSGVVSSSSGGGGGGGGVQARSSLEGAELLLARIDRDELDVVSSQVVELVARLGIKPFDQEALLLSIASYSSSSAAGGARASKDGVGGDGELASAEGSGEGGSVFDSFVRKVLKLERVERQTAEVWASVAKGVDFYGSGTKILGDDISYALSLLAKALQGSTLSQREARTLRRTAKDLITVVPVVIILLIPLSPIGHVLVFSFIQRIFPDFFPSPYTERRQNLMKLYDAIAPPRDEDQDDELLR